MFILFYLFLFRDPQMRVYFLCPSEPVFFEISVRQHSLLPGTQHILSDEGTLLPASVLVVGAPLYWKNWEWRNGELEFFFDGVQGEVLRGSKAFTEDHEDAPMPAVSLS